jgi:hypothetical protein
MMKNMVRSVVILNCILLLACTRIQVQIRQSAEGIKNRTPPIEHKIPLEKIPELDPGMRGGPAARLGADSVVLTQSEGTSCATDRNVTPAVTQETDVWCWAASAQGVMSFHNVSPLQCGIVNRVKANNLTTGDGTTPLCCANNLHSQCQKNGWPDQVFDSYGIDYRWLEGPLLQRQVAGQICLNGPFTYSIRYEGGGGHTFVVKDYWMEEGEMSLWVNTHEYFTDSDGNKYPSRFKKRSYKAYVDGLYDEGSTTTNTVDFTYILIRPQE